MRETSEVTFLWLTDPVASVLSVSSCYWQRSFSSRVHVDVVRGEVESDEEHDQQRPVVISHREETQ